MAKLRSKRENTAVTRHSGNSKPTPIAALGIAGVGLYLLAIGLKFLPVPAGSLHAPHWIMTALGCAVFCAGLAVGLQCLGLIRTWIYKIVVAVILVSMLTPLAWLIFGDSPLTMAFRIGFACPFALILFFALAGKTKIIQNPDGKPMAELLNERRSEPSALQERKLEIEENKKQNGNNEI